VLTTSTSVNDKDPNGRSVVYVAQPKDDFVVGLLTCWRGRLLLHSVLGVHSPWTMDLPVWYLLLVPDTRYEHVYSEFECKL
jgi:hypothetical protein